MSISGPIIVVEDDEDDQLIIASVLQELEVRNEIIMFARGEDVLNYLFETKDKPFVILSDVNMPGMTGTELRARINESDYLRRKSIPFIFFTTYAQKAAVENAYEMMVQGYFEKPSQLDDLRNMIHVIIQYWTLCRHPNS